MQVDNDDGEQNTDYTGICDFNMFSDYLETTTLSDWSRSCEYLREEEEEDGIGNAPPFIQDVEMDIRFKNGFVFLFFF